jgi:hypothetical protein
VIDKFQSIGLTEPYKVTGNLGTRLDGSLGATRRATTGGLMTSAEPRTKMQRELRRQLHNRLAWITLDDGITMRECHVLDVSSGGARIATDDAMDVRDRFELTLVRGHHKRELCEVVWRRGRTYGVKFVAEPPDATLPVNDPTTASGPLS